MNNPQVIKNVLPLDWLIATGQPVTEEKIEQVQQAQRYPNREKIGEPVLWMADLYNELTGQEPNKRTLSDWLLTFEDWKTEGLQAEHIQLAWAQSQDINKGFPVGRPGALTVTAIAIKSKTSKPMGLKINTKGIEETRQALSSGEHWSNITVNQDARQKARDEYLKRQAERNKTQ